MAFNENISAALKRFRKRYKLSQKQVADAIKIPPQSYQTYEYGKSIPSAEVIFKLADAYNVSTDYLLGRSDEPQPIKYDDKEVHDAFVLRDAIKAIMASSKLVEPQAPVQVTA